MPELDTLNVRDFPPNINTSPFKLIDECCSRGGGGGLFQIEVFKYSQVYVLKSKLHNSLTYLISHVAVQLKEL